MLAGCAAQSGSDEPRTTSEPVDQSGAKAPVQLPAALGGGMAVAGKSASTPSQRKHGYGGLLPPNASTEAFADGRNRRVPSFAGNGGLVGGGTATRGPRINRLVRDVGNGS